MQTSKLLTVKSSEVNCIIHDFTPILSSVLSRLKSVAAKSQTAGMLLETMNLLSISVLM